jgi:hypothetical protein
MISINFRFGHSSLPYVFTAYYFFTLMLTIEILSKIVLLIAVTRSPL